MWIFHWDGSYGWNSFNHQMPFKMKKIKIALLLSLFSLMLWTPSQAQIIDSFPWFKDPSRILTPKLLDWNSTFTLQNAPQAISKSQPSMVFEGKKLKLPRDIRVLKGPIAIKRGKNCYQIGCETNKSCGNCQMLWKDLNNDRKIQPRKELRCVCAKSGENCGLRGRKVECE